jgi:hypothetical protein
VRVAAALGVGLATLGIVAACGSDHPRAAEDNYVPPSKGGSTLFSIDDAGSKPPGCGVKDDGTACECVDAPLFIDPPTIYFVLDSSGSMREDDRWTQVRMTVANVMRSLGPRANFGAAAFPGAGAECNPGLEVLPITAGDPPSATADGPAVKKLIAATAYLPSGGTPTSATLVSVGSRLQTLVGRTFVILATDGSPNCNVGAGCTSAQCQPNIEHFKNEDVDCIPNGSPNCCEAPYGVAANCNDGPATISAIAALKGRGIPVYVVGLPGTEFPVYAQLLNQMAEAGGTAQTNAPTQYFAVERGSSDAIQAALKKIAAQITGTCVFDLKEAPADAKLVNVYMDEVVLPQEPLNGWTISGKSVTLVGNACDRVKNGDVLSVRIIAGCPTVYPK